MFGSNNVNITCCGLSNDTDAQTNVYNIIKVGGTVNSINPLNY